MHTINVYLIIYITIDNDYQQDQNENQLIVMTKAHYQCILNHINNY